jgi:hypothetical protein
VWWRGVDVVPAEASVVFDNWREQKQEVNLAGFGEGSGPDAVGWGR